MGTIALYLNPIQTTGAFKAISNFKLIYFKSFQQ